MGRTQRAGVEKPALTVAKDAPDSFYGASEEPKETAARQSGTADTASSGLGIEKGEQRGARLSAASHWRLGQQGRLPHGPSTPAGPRADGGCGARCGWVGVPGPDRLSRHLRAEFLPGPGPGAEPVPR